MFNNVDVEKLNHRKKTIAAAGLFILVILAVSLGCIEQEEPVKKEEAVPKVQEESKEEKEPVKKEEAVPKVQEESKEEKEQVQQKIEKKPSHIVLNEEDVPEGFIATNSTESNDGKVFKVEFEMEGDAIGFREKNPSYQGPLFIINIVGNFNSIDSADEGFEEFANSMSNDYEKVQIEVIGDKSKIYRQLSGKAIAYAVMFRENNIASVIFIAGTYPGTDKNHALKYAKKVEEKITSETLSQPPQVEETTQETTPTKLDLSVGETAKTSKKEVTVVSVKRDKTYVYSSMGESFVQNSNRGKEFILAEVIIKNTGENSIYVDSTDFSLMDSEGYRYGTEFYLGNDGIHFLELYPNQKVRGKILFEVPDSAVGLKIMYNFGDIFTGTNLASWSIRD